MQTARFRAAAISLRAHALRPRVVHTCRPPRIDRSNGFGRYSESTRLVGGHGALRSANVGQSIRTAGSCALLCYYSVDAHLSLSLVPPSCS